MSEEIIFKSRFTRHLVADDIETIPKGVKHEKNVLRQRKKKLKRRKKKNSGLQQKTEKKLSNRRIKKKRMKLIQDKKILSALNKSTEKEKLIFLAELFSREK